ncbi:MAG: ABC transporter permease [Turicibacter sp.]|nr:ABC transporter permease [Turicibacter sp.]
MRKFWITFWFYFKENFTTKNLIILGVFFIGVIGAAFAFDHFSGRYNDLAIVNTTDAFALHEDVFDDLHGWHVHFVDSEDEARAMLDDGDVDEVFVIEGEDRPAFRMISPSETIAVETELFVNQHLMMQHTENVMVIYELPLEAVAELLTPIESSFESLLDTEDGLAAIVIGAILPWILYMLIMSSGSGIATSVVSEKSTRVMELMMGKVHPTTTMLAKVLSYFGDMVVLTGAIAAGVFVADWLNFIDVGTIISTLAEVISLEIVLLSIVIILLGYFMFIFMYAAMGAIAISIDSLNTMLSPVIIMIMIPVFLPMFVDLGNAVMNVLVYIPFFTPFIIVQRFLRGYSSLLEVGIVTVIMTVSMVLIFLAAVRINKNGVTHTSEKTTFSDLKKLLQK